MNHGDLLWSNLVDRGGREQHGRRPCIIWHDCSKFRTSTVLTIPLTSNLNALNIPGTVRVDPTTANGLTLPSVALIFQLNSLDTKRFGNYIGHLDDPDLLKIADIARQLQRL